MRLANQPAKRGTVMYVGMYYYSYKKILMPSLIKAPEGEKQWIQILLLLLLLF